MKIFTIGGSGLVGSRIVELLKDKYIFDDLSLKTGIDITNPASLDLIIKDIEHKIVILLAAKADVDKCEEDREMGIGGEAYKINVEGVQNVVDACKISNKKIIYISTDFVFDGTTPGASGYTEASIPHPISWYGMTKFKGEEVIKNSGLDFVIARIAYPYRREFEAKLDFVRAIKKRLEYNEQILGITDHLFSPTFIDDIANGLDKLIEKNQTGIFHVTGSQSLTPYEASMLIAEKFGFDKNLITKTTRAEYFVGKAPRPFNVSMNNDKIKQLGVKMRTFEEGLEAIK